MKRFAILVAAFALGGSTLLEAQESQPTQRYLVGIRGEAALKQPLAQDFAIPEGRSFERFQSFAGFVAELTPSEVEALKSSPSVRFIEPDYERHLWRTPPMARGRAVSGGNVSSDVKAPGQQIPYGIDVVQARRVWEFGRGARIKVAVVDTGIDYTHPDLAGLYRGGIDIVNNDDDPMDDHLHGTHVAGTIAAIDNDMGVVGVAPEIALYAIKVLRRNEEGGASGSSRDIIKAIDWAIENGMHILNLSLGSNQESIGEREAFQKAANAGILSIAASGNSYEDMKRDGIGFPAGYPTVMAVGAVDDGNSIARFSQRGSGLSLVAPGVAVVSTLPVGSADLPDVEVDGMEIPSVTLQGTPRGTVAGQWHFAGLGGSSSDFGPAARGKIAVIQRGEFEFRVKAKNAKEAGATGVIIINNLPGFTQFNGTLRPVVPETGQLMYPEEESYQFPVTVGITKEDGEKLLKAPGSSIRLSVDSYDYGSLQGTSMATPHVSGVAALVWALAPNASAAMVRNALEQGAKDIGGPGFDTVFGFGVVDAYQSVRILSPEVFPQVPRRAIKR
jgi:serine protease